MKIGIIGAGSIGLLFAAYLSETCDVTVYTRTAIQAQEIKKNGITLIKGGWEIKKKVKAYPFCNWNGQEDLTIVTVKQYHLESIINKFCCIKDKKLKLLFLQNGMGHLKVFPSLENHHIFVGTVEHGAVRENGYTVRHNGEGVTNLAVYKGETESLSAFIAVVPGEFQIVHHVNYYDMLLNKLIVNAVINPLTAILSIQNGLLIQNDHYFQVLKRLFSEISDVLNLSDPDVYFQKVIEVCQNTANNRSSMLKDLESGRKTEVEAILGYLLEEAERKEKTPALIQSLYSIVKGKEMDRIDSI